MGTKEEIIRKPSADTVLRLVVIIFLQIPCRFLILSCSVPHTLTYITVIYDFPPWSLKTQTTTCLSLVSLQTIEVGTKQIFLE